VELIIRKLVTYFAQQFKGKSYSIDSKLPVSCVIGIALRRFCAIIRCWKYKFLTQTHIPASCFIGKKVKFRNTKFINIGKGTTIGDLVLIDGLSKNGVQIEEKVSIGPYTIIEATGVISNIGQGCIIGKNSGIGAFSFIGAAGGVSIGQNVIMGQYVSFHSENHNFSDMNISIREQGVSRQGISIEDNCWIGAKVTFLDGSVVGVGSVIAAGSVVRGVIPPYSVAAGVPAKIIQKRGCKK